MRKFGLILLLIIVAQTPTLGISAEVYSLSIPQSLLRLIQIGPSNQSLLNSCFSGCIQSESQCQFSCMAAYPPTGNQQTGNPQAVIPSTTANTQTCIAQCSSQTTRCRVGCGS
jgi:hypothetical protein